MHVWVFNRQLISWNLRFKALVRFLESSQFSIFICQAYEQTLRKQGRWVYEALGSQWLARMKKDSSFIAGGTRWLPVHYASRWLEKNNQPKWIKKIVGEQTLKNKNKKFRYIYFDSRPFLLDFNSFGMLAYFNSF